MADRARAHAAGDGVGAVEVVGEHRGVEAVDRVVGDLDRLLLVVGRDDRQHRAEDLLARDGRCCCRRCRTPSARRSSRGRDARDGRRRCQRGAFRLALGDVALDPVALPAHGQRAHLGGRVERVADLHRGRTSAPAPRRARRAGGADDDAGQRRADLAGQEGGARRAPGAAASTSESSRTIAGRLAAQLERARARCARRRARRSGGRRRSSR